MTRRIITQAQRTSIKGDRCSRCRQDLSCDFEILRPLRARAQPGGSGYWAGGVYHWSLGTTFACFGSNM